MENLNKQKQNKAAGIIMIAAIALSTLLTFMVETGQAAWLDDPVREFIYTMRSPGLNTLMEGITYLGNWQSITVICLLLLAFDKSRFQYGIPASILALAGVALNKAMKVIIQRPRPDDVAVLIQQGGYSFPSGHSASAMAVFGLLIFLVQTKMEDRKKANRLTVLLAALIFLIGFSRIYLGVHYPSDVLAGWMEGLFLISALVLVTNYLERFPRLPGKREEGKDT